MEKQITLTAEGDKLFLLRTVVNPNFMWLLNEEELKRNFSVSERQKTALNNREEVILHGRDGTEELFCSISSDLLGELASLVGADKKLSFEQVKQFVSSHIDQFRPVSKNIVVLAKKVEEGFSVTTYSFIYEGEPNLIVINSDSSESPLYEDDFFIIEESDITNITVVNKNSFITTYKPLS